MWYIKILFLVAAFSGMEGVAWFTHKFIMHGLLWSLHKDHHKKTSDGFLERNDFFFLFYSIPGIICIFLGYPEFNYIFFIGLGITLYGFTYFFIHDLLIHQRIKFLKRTNNSYLNALKRAHKIHHKHLNKEDGECFGLLLIPKKFFKESVYKG
jgi:beta-carotene 3-hydroxylase